MIVGSDIVQNLTGANIGSAPFFEEQIAVEATNSLRGAEIGLRGFRARPLLRRLWEGVSGEGQERTAAFGQDLVVAQRATLSVVNTIMHESIRTKKCVISVLKNLHQVNSDVDELQKALSRNDEKIMLIREELLKECNKITIEVERTRELALFLVGREAEVRRLGERYRANALHPGVGELVGASLYLALRLRHFYGEPGAMIQAEKSTALAMIKDKLVNKTLPLVDIVSKALNGVEMPALEAVIMVTTAATGPLVSVLGPLMERRLAGVKVDDKAIKETITVVQKLKDPDRRLDSYLFRPQEFIEIFANELENQEGGV